MNNLLYFVDNQRVSQGVFRISYLPAGDSGNGSLDRTSLFSLGGSPQPAHFPPAKQVAILLERNSSPTPPLSILKAISGSASAKPA